MAFHRAQQLLLSINIRLVSGFGLISKSFSCFIWRNYSVLWQSSWLSQRTNYFQSGIASEFATISFFLSKSCRIWKAFLFCSSAQALFSLVSVVNFVGCRKLFSSGFAKVMQVKSLPTWRAGWRVATFRLRAFFRSKTWFRFISWSAWQHAANANRWAFKERCNDFLTG